jgi:hypothetical protein
MERRDVILFIYLSIYLLTYALFNDAVSDSNYKFRIAGWLVNTLLEMAWREAVVA